MCTRRRPRLRSATIRPWASTATARVRIVGRRHSGFSGRVPRARETSSGKCMCTRRRPPAWRRATTPDEARLRAASALRGPADRPRLPILEPIRRHFGVANRVHDIFMAHIVLEGSGVVPIVGELVTSGVPEHVRVNREWELGGFSCPSDHFQKSCRGRWRRRSSLARGGGASYTRNASGRPARTRGGLG